MKVLFLTNNDSALSLADWIAGTEFNDDVKVFHDKLTVAHLSRISPDVVISYSYRHILREDVLNQMPNGFINLHISLLPFNRGADPNAWSFLEDSPKGVSIHLVDQGVDTGPILVQRELHFDENSETLGGAYNKLQNQIQALFRENWPLLRGNKIAARKQVEGGSFHYLKQFAEIKQQLMGEEGWGVSIICFKNRYKKLTMAGGDAGLSQT